MHRKKLLPAVLATGSLILGLGLASFAIDQTRAFAAGHSIADRRIEERIGNVLSTDIALTGSNFRIQMAEGVVRLGGTVPDQNAMRRAISLTAGINGVRDVRNELSFESESSNPK